MARFLIYTSPGPGHVYPPVETALELLERGHAVSMQTGAARVETLRRAGLEAEPIDARIEAIEVDDWKARTPLGATRRLFAAFARRAEYEIEELGAALERVRPDLTWIDINCIGASAAAEAAGVPWGHYLPYPFPVPARGVPAYGPGFPPPTGALTRLRDAAVNAVNGLAFRSVAPPFNAQRKKLGLPAFEQPFEYFVSAPLLLHFSAEPFEYPRTWPPSVRQVGPGLWEPPDGGDGDPQWLTEEERPIVLCTASTEFQDDGALIETALEAFADRPYRLVVTTAAHDPGQFSAPGNAVVERYLPHGPILRRAAAVVSHGGMGTTQKSLAAGVPVCVVPFLRDQFEIARRVEHSGAGTSLKATRLNPERLRTAVDEAISRRPGAERMRERFGQAGGPKAAASALESLAEPAAG